MLLVAVSGVGVLPRAAAAQGDAVAANATASAYFEFLMARRLESEGDNQGALAALQRAAAADPKSAEVRAELASFYLRRNQRSEAEMAAKDALTLDENNVEANRALGLIYAAAAESERTPGPQSATYIRDSITYLERAVAAAAAPDATLQFTLGRMYMRSGAPDKAIQILGRVLNQNPNALQARLSLAQAYAASKDLKSAIATLEEALEDDPRVAPALGQYQEQAGLLSDAIATYTLALAAQPTSRELKFRRIAALYNAKDYGRAAAFAAEARKQHPEDARFPRIQARALFDAGDRSAGLSIMESLAKASPKDTTTQLALVDLYADAGRPVEAEKVLRQILNAEPTNANALNYLGYLLATRGDQLDEAIRLVQQALVSDPDNGAYLDSLGWAYFRRGDLDQAEKYLGQAASQLPDNSEIQDHLGDLYARRSRWEDAIAAWTRALKGDGEDVDKAAIERKINDARARLRR